MKFDASRCIYAYFSFPAGGFSRFTRSVEQRIEAIQEKLQRRRILHSEEDLIIRTYFLVGSTDLLLFIRFRNFRPIPYIQSSLLGSGDLASSWMFAAPYLESANAYIDVWGSARKRPLSGIRFVIHLRVERSVYIKNGLRAEERIVSRIHELINRYENLEAVCAAGFSWSDLVIDGVFSCPSSDFLSFLLKIRGLKLPTGRHVFERTFTVLGFETERSLPQPVESDFEFISLLRTDPGSLAQVYESLRSNEELAAAGSKYRGVNAMVGHADLVVLPDVTRGAEREISRTILSMSHGVANSNVGRSETHLLFPELDPILEEIKNSDSETILRGLDDGGNAAQYASVHENDISNARKRIDRLEEEVMPRSLRREVRNVLSILERALADSLNHFDTQPAIGACISALNMTLGRIEFLYTQLQQAEKRESPDASVWYEGLTGHRNYLREWCHLSLLVLGERSAGSYDELFGASDRVAAVRGSVQKFLFLADQLLAEFFDSIKANLSLNLEVPFSPIPFLTSVFVPVGTVRSCPPFGLVEIPVKFRFSLARALPHMWHEVGTHVFFRRYPTPGPIDSQLEKRLRECAKACREKKVLFDRLREEETQRGEGKTEGSHEGVGSESETEKPVSSREIHDLAPMDIERVGSVSLYKDVADAYADVIVYTFGHRRDFSAFLKDLTVTYTETFFHVATSRRERQLRIESLLLRLFFVMEFEKWSVDFEVSGAEVLPTVLVDVAQGDSRAKRHGAVVRAVQMSKDGRTVGWVEKMVNSLGAGVEGVLRRSRYRSKNWSVSPETVSRVVANILYSHTWSQLYYPFLVDLLECIGVSDMVRKPGEIDDAGSLARGEAIDMGEKRVTPYFYLLYEKEVEHLLARERGKGAPSKNRYRVALGKSAGIAFYQKLDSQNLR